MAVLVLSLAGLASAQTARFPGAVATDQDLLTAVDNAFSTLASPVADGAALTITVNSGASFAGKTNFSVTIEGEQILVCSVVANTLNVCPGGRGFAGTVAAAHPSGVAVRGNVTAWHHNAVTAEVKAVEDALGANLGNVEKPLTFDSPLARATNAISCPTCVVTSGTYSDPAWLAISKAKVGLGDVENTALSTWPGSANISAIGTLASGTVPWARLADVPASFAPTAHTHAGGEVTSSVATATALAVDPADCAAGSAAKGVDASGTATGCIAVPNKQLNFAVWDPNTAIPSGTAVWVWSPERGPATLTQVRCMSDTGDGVIQIQSGAAADVLSANLTCISGGFASTTSFTNAAVPQGYGLAYRVISGTAKQYTFSITYTGN